MRAAALALLYLWSRSALNLLLARLRRLRQPKYLVGAVMALAYLWFVFIYPHAVRTARRAGRAAAGDALRLSPVDAELLASAVAVALLLMFALLWLWRRARTSL